MRWALRWRATWGSQTKKLLRAESDFLRVWDETFHGRTVATARSAQHPLLHLRETRRLPPTPSTEK